MFTGLSNALKGIGGDYEVQRLLGAIGTLTYTFTVPAFVVTGVIKNTSVTEFCLAYPGGLAACIGATAGAIALKDRNTATSKVITETGSMPSKGTSDTPQPVVVTNQTGNPVPTTDQSAP
jgi:hypothetical protein